MDLKILRQMLLMQPLSEIALRVAVYTRVSTESKAQINSLGNQQQHYKDFVAKNPKWTLYRIYVDEGTSGVSTKKREAFNQMIDDAAKGKFDIIFTKEISRFARNTLDSIAYTRELLSYNVPVVFENDGIATYDNDSELRLTIMASLAQEESRRLSSRVRFGQNEAVKKQRVFGNNRIFGYTKDKARLVIDENQAAMVRELFELYSTGQYSMKQIEQIFWDRGYRNLNGKRISHTTMSGIISNPKYKGYYTARKTETIDLFTKKQVVRPIEEQVIVKDETGLIVPAIVSEELWERANAVLCKRSADVKNRQGICNHPNLLTGKMVCSCCGTPYYRKDSRDRTGQINNKWVCSGKIKNGADSCSSIPLYEDELKPLLFEVFQETEANADALIEEYVQMYQALNADDLTQKQIEAQRARIEENEKMLKTLLRHCALEIISDEEYIKGKKECTAEIEDAKAMIQELEQQQVSTEEFGKHIAAIRKALKGAQADASTGLVSKEFVDTYIDKILATPQPDGTIALDIKIFTGESTRKYLAKLRSRTGQRSKKMIEAYEQAMQ